MGPQGYDQLVWFQEQEDRSQPPVSKPPVSLQLQPFTGQINRRKQECVMQPTKEEQFTL